MALSIPYVVPRENAARELKQLLSRSGMIVFSEDILENGIRFHGAYEDKSFSLILYFSAKTGRSSKVVLEKDFEEIRELLTNGSRQPSPTIASAGAMSNPALQALKGKSRMGIDESGKGDYFGPLTIAGVCVGPDDEERLLRLGVRDSKLAKDNQIASIAGNIRSLIGEKRIDLILINPQKYNELYGRIRNLNRLLAWGHARVVENLLGRTGCAVAICDQFGDESYIRNALMNKGKAATLIQSPRAEQDVAVAAASILARDAFLRKLAELSQAYGIALPKGATTVAETAREFVKTHGAAELGKVAKLHFKTTEKVMRNL